jgi:hypothetical protein
MNERTLVNKFWRSVQRGAKWLVQQQRADGSFVLPGEDPAQHYNGYYKIPYALAVCGHAHQAHRLLDWALRSGALSAEGDLIHKVWHEECYSYANSWMIIGAQRLGRFDVSQPAMTFLRRLISPATGGVCAELRGALTGSGWQDMVSSSQAGSACLYMGESVHARRIGDWFVTMLSKQPDVEHALYACCDAAGRLISDFLADKANTYVVDTSRPWQWFFYPGIAMGFLSKLYLATQEARYLSASATYFDVFARCHEQKWTNGTSGKVAWGSAQMYRITGEKKYRDAAVRLGEWMLDIQFEDGHWDPGPQNPNIYYLKLDATAEFVAWQAEIAQHLDR